MATPYLRIDEPETTEEMGTKTEFTIYPWGMTIGITVEDEGRVHTNYAMIPSEKLALLRIFLNRHLEG